ncbi:uncharacterized protein LOC113855685 [Abrus precatorius]|uniref:Uncharacterized protein LOC113855685 n=1 Tax=Abrus precatorius TaxID=3816 RepID=A0A8B8KH70_ABRPR|nr:uncharacterized protein LOC113855685 [Abrus precatorius]
MTNFGILNFAYYTCIKNNIKKSGSIAEYLVQVKQIVKTLAAIGSPLSVEDHIDAICDGLGEDYDGFITSCITQTEPYIVAEIEALLMHKEERLERHKQHPKSTHNNTCDATMQEPINQAMITASATQSSLGDTWYPDIGATNHFTNDLSNLMIKTPYIGLEKVVVGNGNCLSIHNIGTSKLRNPSNKIAFTLNKLLHDSRKLLLQGKFKDGLYAFENMQLVHPNSDFPISALYSFTKYLRCHPTPCNIHPPIISVVPNCNIPRTEDTPQPTSLVIISPKAMLFDNVRLVLTKNTNTSTVAIDSNTGPSSRAIPLVINNHPMVIRGKAGIFKLKAMVAEMEPITVREALQSPKWIQAMHEKLKALKQNQTWDLVPLPLHRKPVGSKWIFKLKYNPDGSISKYKARLVARGFTQKHGLDYQKTFSSVGKHVTIRVILSIALSRGWSVRQVDVNNTFLNGPLKEVVYIRRLSHQQS